MMQSPLTVVFWVLVGLSIIMACLIFIPAPRKYKPFRVLASLMIILSLLGGGLIFLTLKQNVGGALKVFLILAGASPAAMVVSVILHNTICALAKGLFGKEFEEAVFFIIGVFGCPAALLTGITGVIVLIIRNMIQG